MNLPNDIARCDGADFPECRDCLRRIALRSGSESVIAPPTGKVDNYCCYLIADDNPYENFMRKHMPSDEKPLINKG